MKPFLLIGGLRLVTGIAQFGIIVLLAASLSLDDLGTYSLLVIFLTYATQLAGLNFNTFVLREQTATPRPEWPHLLQQQWTFLLASTAVVSAAILMLQWIGLVRAPSLGWFLALLALTVFNTQHESFLIGAGRAVSAASNLLLRTSWVYAMTILHFLGPAEVTLETVLMAWVAAELLGCGFMAVKLKQDDFIPRRWTHIDWQWLRRGAGVGLQYTVLGLFLIVSFSIQRVILGQHEGEAAVGIFHFFYAISVFGPNLLEASLFAVLLPRLIEKGRSELQRGQLLLPPTWCFFLLGGLSILGLCVVYLVLPIFVALIGKPELAGYMGLFLFTAGYAVIYSLARIFHYGLYSVNADNWLLGVNTLACMAACVSSIILIGSFGLEGAAYSLLLTGTILLVGNGLPYASNAVGQLVVARK